MKTIFFLLHVYTSIAKCNHDSSSTTVVVLTDRSKHDNSVFAPTGHEGMTATVIIYYTAWDCYSLEVVSEKCPIYWSVLESAVLVDVFCDPLL